MTLTDEVVASFATTPDPRTRQLVGRLVAHRHAYAREVALTFDEWRAAIEFLTRAGQMSGPTRQELILLSDVLGLSMLVEELAQRDVAATDATVLGPFYVGEHRPLPNGASIADGMAGEPLLVETTIRDTAGAPIAGATADVWHADADGFYDSQKAGYALDRPSLRARFTSDADGKLWFRTIVPCSYPIPTDGPVGDLLRATNRHAMRPAHIHFYIRAPGKAPLVTHVFVAGDSYLKSDAVFGVKPSLVAPLETDANGSSRLAYDFVLGGAA
ncbi:MAG TPA: dioxygenase [Kofleriaceae bacterium]|nr:dioxygenase [Kofleriaceae bacterium]